MDYAGLVQQVSDWLDRDDLGSQIPGFIALFEARFDRLVRSREVTTLWAVTSGTYTLPSDFRRLRKLAVDGSPDRTLTQVSPDDAVKLFGGQSGTPTAYSIEGDTSGVQTIYLYPSGDASLRVSYFSKLPALTSSASTNWLSNDHGDLYLAGTLLYAASYIDDPDQAAKFTAYTDQAIEDLNTALRNDKWGTPLAPRGPMQVRGARC